MISTDYNVKLNITVSYSVALESVLITNESKYTINSTSSYLDVPLIVIPNGCLNQKKGISDSIVVICKDLISSI